MSITKVKCETCRDTGWYGDNGPGIICNRECHPCDQCNTDPANFALNIINKQKLVINSLRADKIELYIENKILHDEAGR